MPITICFYEDDKYTNFYPLTLVRPAYALRAGIVPLYARAKRQFPEAGLVFCCRAQLAGIVAEQYKDYPVNIIKRTTPQVLLLNGRIRQYGNLPKLVSEARLSTRFVSQGETVAVLFMEDSLKGMPPVCTPEDFSKQATVEGEQLPEHETSATLYSYIWEVMADIESEITSDFRAMESSFPVAKGMKIHDGAFWVNQDDVYLGNDVEVLPGAVIDASNGPVYIGDLCRVEPHAAIYGPTFVGPNSVVLAGKVSSSSIGHTCRVGGEIEQSVFHSYVNKYHDGFIGHSYVGSWVNFGAMTTNSDLKNNYASIRVSMNGQQIDTGSNKVGSFIGDHTKFGIGTLLNTGINIGIASNIFGGSLVVDKEVPPFSWGTTGSYTRYEIEKAIDTARTVTMRRHHTLTDNEIELLRAIAAGTANDIGVIRL
jgi:UDP-N-acetylglucosamine diphosphorylase/glucosamine-1-phosphate N-acetyltransferase